MIGKITGTLQEVHTHEVIVDVNGVGYEIFLPELAIQELGHVGATVSLFIHTNVREDEIKLYGFKSKEEKIFFLQLLSVSGIGAKSAMQIMSSAPIAQTMEAIQLKNTLVLQKTPGIGKKTAERLVVELSDKIKGFKGDGRASMFAAVLANDPKQEIISALVNLGYKRIDSEEVVSQMDFSENPSFDKILKESLKRLGR